MKSSKSFTKSEKDYGKLKNKTLPNDVYTWKLEVADQKNKLHQHIGHVSLIN